MSLPIVAVIGRPNVGKSSLFNAISRRRTNIVEPTAGVTRDRVTTICDVDEVFFELVDTGGYGLMDRDELSEDVDRQINHAVVQAQLILFVVDAREGLTPVDREAAKLLRPHSDRVRLIGNKVDEPHSTDLIAEFVRLGFGAPLAVSARSFAGLRALRELIRDRVAEFGGEVPADPAMKIAVVGKRNAGKSTFINALAGEERVIVSEIPGTTRDSVDVRFEKEGRTLVAIDTAGVRKKNKMADDIEFYAHTRAVRAVQRADVVLLLIDATTPVGQVDKRLAKLITGALKPCVLVINKWDLAKGRADSEDFREYLTKVLPEIGYAPLAFTTAIDGRNIGSTIDLATRLFKQSRTRIGTGTLNQVLREIVAGSAVPSQRGRKRPKFLYATQISTQPPTVVLFVNDAELVSRGCERFLINRFREHLPFDEIPIRLVCRSRRERG